MQTYSKLCAVQVGPDCSIIYCPKINVLDSFLEVIKAWLPLCKHSDTEKDEIQASFA